MSPLSIQPTFQSLTRLGVKCVMVSDALYAGSDTIATSYILSEALKRLQPDLIFCGRQSVDGDTAQTPPMLAQRLGFAIKTKVMEFDKESGSVTLRNGERFSPQNQTILTFEKIRTLRFPSIFSKLQEVEVWDNQTLGLDKEKCGLLGSPTRVVRSYESSVGRRNCQFFSVEDLPSLIEKALQKQRMEQTKPTGEKLDEAYFIGHVQSVAESIAKKAISFQIKDKNPQKIADELSEKKVKTLLWEDSEELKVLASKVAVLTGAGLCADCISFRVENGKLIMTRPALGGNVTADIVAESEMAFATVRTVKKECADVIFSVGKGGIEYIEKIKEFAQKYSADKADKADKDDKIDKEDKIDKADKADKYGIEVEVCCSRIVADSGKLPYEKQVGLTGRTVCPKVYVAFGVSGAVQHTCAIEGAGTVIAVNVDKNARIFDYADYGIIAEVKNVEL